MQDLSRCNVLQSRGIIAVWSDVGEAVVTDYYKVHHATVTTF